MIILGVETERALVEWTKQPGDGVIRYITEPLPWGWVFKNKAYTYIAIVYYFLLRVQEGAALLRSDVFPLTSR